MASTVNPLEMALQGYELGTKIGTDISTKNILQQAYEGQDVSNMSPQEQQGTIAKAAAMANARGLGSIAHRFQKEAQELGKGAADQQAAELKAKQGKLELASQYVVGASSVGDLRKAYELAGADPAQKLYIEGILNRQLDSDPAKDLQMKKDMVHRIGLTANQDIAAQLKLLNSSIAQQKVEISKEDLARKERKDANKSVGKGDGSKANDKLIAQEDRLDNAEAKRITQIEASDRTQKEKDAAIQKTREEYENKRNTARERRGKKEDKKESVTVKGGKTYSRPAKWSDEKWSAYKQSVGG